MEMKKAYLIRTPGDEKQTLGALVARNGKEVFVARSLELGDHDNAPNISCIPAGNYRCKWTYSPTLKTFTYEILDVPNRTGIRIHSVNFFRQLLGCVGLGNAHKDIDIDGQLDITHSGDTVKQFNAIMNMEEFELVIRWAM